MWVYDISPKEKFYTELESGQKISGRFLDVTYRKDLVRKKIKFEEYFGKTDIDWFDELEIYTRDIEYANVVLEEEHKIASESGDETAISGYLMANPRTVEHTFLVEGQSWFDNNEIEACQSNLRENYTPLLVTLHNTSDRKVSWRNSTLKPIQKFPVRATDNKLAPVEIYEPPIEGAPRYTYVLGIDPLTSEESNDKIVSLGSACVYKRMLNPLDEFKDTVVASYSGRPEKLVEFHEVCLMLAKMYNCEYTTLPEYSESSLIQYFQRTGNTHYLCPSLELTKYIQKNSHQQGAYGLKPTVKNIEHYMALMKDRMKGDSYTVDGLEYITGDSGMKNIRWYMLLEEMKHYKSAGKGRGHGLNVDRIVAYGHALVMADWLDIQYGKLYNSKKFDSPKEEVYVPKSQGVFLGRGNMSFGGNRSIFR